MELEGHHSEAEVSTERIIGEDHIKSIIIGMTLEEAILEKCKITEVNILGVEIEGITEMTTLEEVEVGLEKDNIHVTLRIHMHICMICMGLSDVRGV